MLLRQAKDLLFDSLRAGEKVMCPCCDKSCKYQQRPLNSNQARGLIWLYGESRFGFVVVAGRLPMYLARSGGEFATMRHWGLIEQQEKGKDAKTRTSGVWRVTDRGRNFVLNMITVPHAMVIYNATVVGADNTKRVSISEVLRGNGFDYNELMGIPPGIQGRLLYPQRGRFL